MVDISKDSQTNTGDLSMLDTGMPMNIGAPMRSSQCYYMGAGMRGSQGYMNEQNKPKVDLKSVIIGAVVGLIIGLLF